LEFKLIWDGVPGRIYYEVWVSTDYQATWSKLAQTSKNAHLHSDLTEGKSYSYKVNAVTTAGAGNTCLPVTAKAA
jgi:fibronectin type 3 domain-containing protein